jgi:protein-S-isoprenylcysteine O-methyltransferase Ste14
MSTNDLPAVIATITIWAYWCGIGVMIARVKRRARHVPILMPAQPLERFMGLIWIPLVVLCVVFPYLAQTREHGIFALPQFATTLPAYAAGRWLAALLGVACLGATIRCWARMGKDWRMAVAVGEKTNLITDGLFSRIRHPIYAFSIMLMVCTAIVIPTLPFVLVALAHIALWNVKARNEERYLLDTQGEEYKQYVQRTGRFFPRIH